MLLYGRRDLAERIATVRLLGDDFDLTWSRAPYVGLERAPGASLGLSRIRVRDEERVALRRPAPELDL